MEVFINTNEYSDEELVKIAKKRIRLKRSLYSHIATYVVVNAFLIFVYFITRESSDHDTPWFVWVLTFWGIGLILDIINTVQNLRLTYNYGAVNKEVEKLKRSLKK